MKRIDVFRLRNHILVFQVTVNKNCCAYLQMQWWVDTKKKVTRESLRIRMVTRRDCYGSALYSLSPPPQHTPQKKKVIELRTTSVMSLPLKRFLPIRSCFSTSTAEHKDNVAMRERWICFLGGQY